MIMFSFKRTQQNEHFRILLTNTVAHCIIPLACTIIKINHQSGGKHAQVNNRLSIYHTDAKKLVYFFQYTKKCSEIKLAMHDFV